MFDKKKIMKFLKGNFKDNEMNEFSIRKWLKMYTEDILTASEGDHISGKYVEEKEIYVAVHMINAGLIEGEIDEDWACEYDRRGYKAVMKQINEMLWNGELNE